MTIKARLPLKQPRLPSSCSRDSRSCSSWAWLGSRWWRLMPGKPNWQAYGTHSRICPKQVQASTTDNSCGYSFWGPLAMSQATMKDNSWTNSKEAKRLNQKTQNHYKTSSHKSHKTLNHNTWIQSPLPQGPAEGQEPVLPNPSGYDHMRTASAAEVRRSWPCCP